MRIEVIIQADIDMSCERDKRHRYIFWLNNENLFLDEYYLESLGYKKRNWDVLAIYSRLSHRRGLLHASLNTVILQEDQVPMDKDIEDKAKAKLVEIVKIKLWSERK